MPDAEKCPECGQPIPLGKPFTIEEARKILDSPNIWQEILDGHEIAYSPTLSERCAEEVLAARERAEKAEADTSEGWREAANLRRAIEKEGLRTCDVPACNCGGLHDDPEREYGIVSAYRKRTEKAEADNVALQEIVDKLPKTADGVPVVQGDTLFGVSEKDGRIIRLTADEPTSWAAVEDLPWDFCANAYSTREAAEAGAKKAKEQRAEAVRNTIVFRRRAWEAERRGESLDAEIVLLRRERGAIFQEARVWAGEAKAQRHTVNEVGSALGGVPDWGPIAKGVRGKLEALRKALAEVERLQGENLALNLALFHVENGLGHPDPHVRALIEAAKAVRAAKPESEGE